MKVIVLILVLVVLVLSFLQLITRIEVIRLRRKEVAVDTQIEVLQKRVTNLQLTLESGCLDVSKLERRLNGQVEANAEVFNKVNCRIDAVEAIVKKPAQKKAKKTEGDGAQQQK